MSTITEQLNRISYYDLDCRGRLKFSALLRMVHIAADVNATELGVGFTDLNPLGISFVLQRFSAAAFRLPVYGEEIRLRTWPADIVRGTFIRKGDMYATDGKKLMEWASLWLLFDINARKIRKPSALPSPLIGLGALGTTTEPAKIEIPPDWPQWGDELSTHTHTVRYADTDTNNHMNNAIYGDVVGNAAYPTNTAPPPWQSLHINYQAEARPDEEIKITARHSSNKTIITGETNRRTFTALVS
jgi:acyl-ACP thioesterase